MAATISNSCRNNLRCFKELLFKVVGPGRLRDANQVLQRDMHISTWILPTAMGVQEYRLQSERKMQGIHSFCKNAKVTSNTTGHDYAGKRTFSVNAKTSDVGTGAEPWQEVMDITDEDTANDLGPSLFIYKNFISEEEEKSIFDEIEPYMKRLRYEKDHWDDAIHGYRETERKVWSEKNKHIIQRVRDVAFPPGTPQLAYVHVLDLQKTGYIKPHIDSVKFCGSTIAGISLLSSSVMRFVHDKDKTQRADVLVARRSLYIMTGSCRYDYTHEILSEENSFFRGKPVPRDRRISVICRNEPTTWSEPVP